MSESARCTTELLRDGRAPNVAGDVGLLRKFDNIQPWVLFGAPLASCSDPSLEELSESLSDPEADVDPSESLELESESFSLHTGG